MQTNSEAKRKNNEPLLIEIRRKKNWFDALNYELRFVFD